MAVRIPIVTVFDSKGLKQAQYALNKVRGNFQNLGRNFAVAGAAFAGAAAVIAKSAQDLARIERINAQTEAVLKSMGNSAGVTAQHIQDLAGNLERLTASEAETIQEGANLLLTFRNIQNQVGANNDIFDQAVTMSVDLARAMGTEASGEAIRLGKALNDPTKGVAALTRVGVSFTEQQKEQIKTLQESGDLLGAQKIILGELQAQFGGSGQAYAATFAGQVELLNHELGALGEEATMVVMPALQTMVASLRELAPEVGAKLSAAIASVDWKAFTEGIVNAITFLVQNAETIMKVVTAMFLLNTAYNAGRVAVGLYTAATVILNGSMKTATGLAGGLRTALFLGGVTLAVGSVIDSYRKLKTAIQETNTPLSQFDTEVLSISKAAGEINPITKLWNNLTNAILNALTAKRNFEGSGTLPPRPIGTGFGGSDVKSWLAGLPKIGGKVKQPDLLGSLTDFDGGGTKKKTFAQELKQQARVAKLEGRLIKKGLSEGLAGSIVAGGGVEEAKRVLGKIADTSGKYAKRIQKIYSKTKQGQQELKKSTEEMNEAASGGGGGGGGRRNTAATEEKELDQRATVYKSFLDSVKGTFSSIKDQILGAFKLPELGGSTDSIIRNMNKLLAKTRSFSDNITQLSSMGLSPELLEQIISQGPVAGAKLAQALVSGGAASLAEINAGYAEMLAQSSAIATTGTNALFGTRAQQNIYNIEVNGGLDTGPTIGQAIVEAITAYERTSGAVWQRS